MNRHIKKVIGRPRKLELEAKVIGRLSEGVRVGVVAAELGLHRNTVRKIRNRIKFDPDSSAAAVLIQFQEEIESLRVEQEQISERQRETMEKANAAKLQFAIEQLVEFIEKAASAVEKCKSVWTQVYLDKSLPNGGTVHDLVGSKSGDSMDPSQLAEQNEIAQLLNAAIDNLSEFQARVIRLGFFEGQDNQEIAESLGASEDEVCQAQSAAFAVLRNVAG